MAGTLTPTPYQTVLDADGVAVSGALIYTYVGGTTTAAATYTTSSLSVANTNPIVADSGGRFVAYLPAGGNFKFTYKTAAGATIEEQDNILSVPGAAVNLDIEGTVGQAVTAGQVCYLSTGAEATPLTAGLWYLTDADFAPTSTTCQSIGVAVSAIAINTAGTIRLAGTATMATAVVIGSTYYVSATAGAITATAPALSRTVGVALTTSTLLLAATTAVVTPAGSNTQVQFNDSGVLGGDAGFTYIKATDAVTIAGATTVGGTLGVTGVTTLTGGLNTPLVPAQGGTGLSSYAVGDLVYASGSTTLAKLADVAVGQVLVSGGVATAPAYSASPSITALTYITNLKSTTALATPGALSATQATAFASTVSGSAIMGFGTTNDVSLMNRAGTVVLGVGPNTTAVNMTGALAVTGITTFAAGSAAAPALTTTGDTDTGVYFPVADEVAISAGGNTVFNASSSMGFKNRIINGGMVIDQRNAAASQTFTAAGALAYSVDRWYGYCTGANVTGQQVAGSTTPTNTQFRYRFTGAASVTAVGFGQRIEQKNSYDLAGSTATLSADLAISATLTTVTWTASYATTTADTFGSLASPTVTQIATGTFTVSATVTKFNAQITIPAAATTGIQIVFTVGALTAGLTWTIGNVQLEKGSAATSFDYRSYGTELALCQRYYETNTIGTPIDSYGGFAAPPYALLTSAVGVGTFRTTKRAAPTVVLYDNAGTVGTCSQIGVANTIPATASQITVAGFQAVNRTSSSFASNALQPVCAGYTASAEL